MAIPLKKGYKFRVEHVTKPASNYMPSFDIYEKYYGIRTKRKNLSGLWRKTSWETLSVNSTKI